MTTLQNDRFPDRWDHLRRPFVKRLAHLPVWVLNTPNSRPLNCLLVEGHSGLVLVNTGMSVEHGQTVRKMINTLSGRPVNTIIYPHHHRGHCQGTAAIIEPKKADSGEVVVVAAKGWDTEHPPPDQVVPPNLSVNRECVLELAGVVVHLLPPRLEPVSALSIYLPEHKVALIADEPCMWKHHLDSRPATTPLADTVERLLPFSIKYLLGSHMLPVSGREAKEMLSTYLESTRLGMWTH